MMTLLPYRVESLSSTTLVLARFVVDAVVVVIVSCAWIAVDVETQEFVETLTLDKETLIVEKELLDETLKAEQAEAAAARARVAELTKEREEMVGGTALLLYELLLGAPISYLASPS